MVQQEPLHRLWRIGIQPPGALALADGVPGPDRGFVQRGHMGHRHLDHARRRGDARPVPFGKAVLLPDLCRQIQVIAPVNLPQPGVLRPPGVIHRHGALCKRMQGKACRRVIAKRRVPDRQRVHCQPDPGAQGIGRLHMPMPFGSQLKPAHRFGIDGKQIGLRGFKEPHLHRPILIGRVPGLEIAGLFRNMRLKEAAIGDIGRNLIGVRRAAPHGIASAAKAHQRPHTGLALMHGDILGVVAVHRLAVRICEPRQPQPDPQIDQHRLKPPHIAVRLHHRPADGIARRPRLADRAVEQADAIVPLHIGGIGQDQVGIGHHLGRIGIGIDDARDHILAILALIRQHLHHGGGVHGGIPRHVRHVKKQRVDPVGIAGMGIGNDHMHHAMRRERVFPGEGTVNPRRRAVCLQCQLLWPAHIAQMRPRQRLARHRVEMRRRMRLDRFRIGRLHPVTARHIHRPQQNLQQVQGPRGLEPVGMGRNPAHGMERHGAPHHCGMGIAPEIRPGLIQHDHLVKGHPRQFCRQFTDAPRRKAHKVCHRFRRMPGRKIAFRQMLEHGAVALPDRPKIRLHALCIPAGGHARAPVDHEGLAFGIAHEQALGRPVGFVQKERRIRPLRQIVQINLARLEQAMDQRQDQQPVGAGRDPQPVIGHGIVAGADRVDPDHPRAALLQLAQPDLDRIAVMVFGHAEHHEQLGAVPVRLPEFPERPADGVNPRRRHVHRTKAAVCCIIRRAEHLRPPAGQALALIATGEKGQLFGRRLAQWFHPGHGQVQRLVPGNLLKGPRPARPHPLQGRAQPRRGGDLPDP